MHFQFIIAKDRCITRNPKRLFATIIGEELSKPVRNRGSYRQSAMKWNGKFGLRKRFHLRYCKRVLTIGRLLVVETETINEEATQAGIEQAKEAVEPTRILQGQVLSVKAK